MVKKRRLERQMRRVPGSSSNSSNAFLPAELTKIDICLTQMRVRPDAVMLLTRFTCLTHSEAARWRMFLGSGLRLLL
jgi:hypothetical protein